ncbi:MAG: hypothetical protein J7604_07755 [Sporocytophaga sp.]|nr:hypothetical protein [Sporocytophaga sp.]MBO9700091.1 hypothetical protein [Sporocytophaga sp.]
MKVAPSLIGPLSIDTNVCLTSDNLMSVVSKNNGIGQNLFKSLFSSF